MSCGRDHFEPISSKVNPGWPDPSPAWQEYFASIEKANKPRNPNWGGRRRGAGAPKENLNALRHGRYSTKHKDLIRLLQSIPGVEEILSQIARQQEYRKKKTQVGASLLLAEILRRVGETLINPENNRLEHNQDLLAAIDTLEDLLRQEAAEKEKSSFKSS